MANWETEFVRLIKEICNEENIILTSFDDWAFRVQKGEKNNFIYGYQFGLDNAATAAILKDKAAASEMMAAADIAHVPHWCVMNPSEPEFCSLDSGWQFLEEKITRYGEIVVKDNLGTGGRLVFRVRTRKELEKACQEIFFSASSLAVSPYIPIDEEYRVIVLDGQVEVMFSKERPHLTGDGKCTVKELLCDMIMKSDDSQLRKMFMYGKQPDSVMDVFRGDYVPEKNQSVVMEWKHNLGQGSSARIVTDIDLKSSIYPLVKKVLELFKLRFASIDVIKTGDSYMVLEINSGVMMENLAKTNEVCRNLAKETYRKAIKLMLDI